MKKQTAKQAKVSTRSNRKVCKALARVRTKYGIKGAFTKAHFLRICEEEKIELLTPESMPESQLHRSHMVRGMYVQYEGIEMIWLECFWQKRFRLDIALHELGHRFLHRGSSPTAKRAYRQSAKYRDRIEGEANLFSQLARHSQVIEANCKNSNPNSV